eukprot:TRINITY_DN4319_c0_g1_i6.p1 TRINITY_DN4319_c0_g1~~TRINITY_DN4319_c0_g1_i6.p1  ORF type:complete len:322 (+),score=87.45 TRINITY_DN4319_c0_g1_i6:223-1188(+)
MAAVRDRGRRDILFQFRDWRFSMGTSVRHTLLATGGGASKEIRGMTLNQIFHPFPPHPLPPPTKPPPMSDNTIDDNDAVFLDQDELLEDEFIDDDEDDQQQSEIDAGVNDEEDGDNVQYLTQEQLDELSQGGSLDNLAIVVGREDLDINSEEVLEEMARQDQSGEVGEMTVNSDAYLVFQDHQGPVYCVGLHPSKPLAISGDGDDKAYMWDTDTGETIATIDSHSDTVMAASFSSDGKYAATASLDGTVCVIETETTEVIATLEGPGEGILWMEWHPKGHIVIAGSEDTTVWMWNAPKGALMQVFAGHQAPVTCGGFTPDG